MSSALSAHGDESLRLWLPQPPFRPRSPEKHLHAGPQPLRLASTFRWAQYNPAEAGPGHGRQRVGEWGGLGGCGSRAGRTRLRLRGGAA